MLLFVSSRAFTSFGDDPLKNNIQLVTQREAEFHARYPDFNNFLVNGNLFSEGVLFLIDTCKILFFLLWNPIILSYIHRTPSSGDEHNGCWIHSLRRLDTVH